MGIACYRESQSFLTEEECFSADSPKGEARRSTSLYVHVVIELEMWEKIPELFRDRNCSKNEQKIGTSYSEITVVPWSGIQLNK